MSRIVAQFSCGAASAVAAKLTLAEHGHENVVLLNAYIQEEHADNRRFLLDCERWLGKSITVVQNDKYSASTHEVWRKKRYIKGMYGAPCSKELKRDVLNSFARPDDVYVIGYTVEEEDRVDQFLAANNGRKILTPLIDKNLTKADCLAMIERAGIELPAMYLLGFDNANCIGCCKGGEKYWKKIRRVFPDQFVQIAEIQKRIGPGANIFRDRKTERRYSLYDLAPDDGQNDPDEPEISCSFFCEMAEQDIAAGITQSTDEARP